MKIIVTGTDTDVGKTIFSAALAGALGGSYWKPIQAGLVERDTATVRTLSGLGASKMLAEAYRLTTPCSPHRAAELDYVGIKLERIRLPQADPLVVEGAGGLLVPINRNSLLVDLFAHWQLPAVLVARTAMGTINHSLLSIEALRSRSIPLLGIAFVGAPEPDTEHTICDFAKVKRLGRLPILNPLDQQFLSRAFAHNFDLSDFR